MSAHGFSTYRCPPVSQRPLGLNPWHQPQACTPMCRRPRRRLLLQCAAVEQELDVADSFASRAVQRHDSLGHDLPEGLDIVIQGDASRDDADPHLRIKKQLKETVSLLQLRMLLESDSEDFDPIHITRALSLAAKIHRGLMQQLRRAGMLTPEAAARHRQEHLEPCLVALDSLVRQHINDMDAWGVSSSLWAYATLDHYDRHVFDVLCTRALQLEDMLKPVDCANILWAFGQWGHYQPELLRAVTQALLDHMYDAKPHEVSQTLWGFARLRVPAAPGRPFLDGICEAIKPTLHLYPSQELSTVVWALAKLKFYPGAAFLQQVESIMLRRVRGSGPKREHSAIQQHPTHADTEAHDPHRHQQDNQGMHSVASESVGACNSVPAHSIRTNTAAASSKGRQGVPMLSATTTVSLPLHPRAAPPHQVLRPQDLGQVLWALGQFRYKAAKLLDEVPLCLGAWLPHFTIQDTCCLLVGYAHARHYHAGVLEVVAPLLAPRVHMLGLAELVSVLWAYGLFQHRPVSEPRFLPMLSAALLNRLERGSPDSRTGERPQTHALIVKACANLQFRPEVLLKYSVRASAMRLQEFRPDEMASLLYGLSHLASRAPACELPPTITTANSSSAATITVRSVASRSRTAAVAAPPLPALVVDGDVEDVSTSGLHPALEPEEMQLFYGVVRRCMRLLDEPNQPYGSRSFMHHKVLNSILFSCLRIGYTPWALIDFAESKGMRLTTPPQLKDADWDAAESAATMQAAHGLPEVSSTSLEQAASQLTTRPPRTQATLPGRANSGHTTALPVEFDPRSGGMLHGHARGRGRHSSGRSGRQGMVRSHQPRRPLFQDLDQQHHESDEHHQYDDSLNGLDESSSSNGVHLDVQQVHQDTIFLADAVVADHLASKEGSGINSIHAEIEKDVLNRRPWRAGSGSLPILHAGLPTT